MSLIAGSERVLYDHVIIGAKLNVDDFEITEERDAPGIERKGRLGHAGTGTVTVLYRPTGITHQYRGGAVPPPFVEFERELNLNEFMTRQRSRGFRPFYIFKNILEKAPLKS